MSIEKVVIALVAVLVVVVTAAILWENLDENHQATTRMCLQRAKTTAECVRFAEVP